MKKSKLYLSIIVTLFSLHAFSQEKLWYEKNLPAYKAYFENTFGIVCTPPVKFKNLDKYYVIWKVREDKAKHSGGMYGPIFLSKDRKCMVAFPVQLIMDYPKEKDQIKRRRQKSGFPQSEIMGEIRTSLGLYYRYKHPSNNDAAKVDFHDYVTTISGRQPREMFNADSVFVYSLPDADSVFFFDEELEKMRSKKYPYCIGLFICKKDRATMNLKLFFTQKGFKNSKQYINMLSKKIWYDEDFRNE